MKTNNLDIFGFFKTNVDAHTMGICTIANILKDCGLTVHIANNHINLAAENITNEQNYNLIKTWIIENNINRLGFSYRLDPTDGCRYFLDIYTALKNDNMFIQNGGPIRDISFAGLPDTCELISNKTHNNIILFPGNETPIESLKKYKIPSELFPTSIVNECEYDKTIWSFSKQILSKKNPPSTTPQDHYGYPECGGDHDSYLLRLEYAKKSHSLPIIRTHSGPYNPNRQEALREYNEWCRKLATSKLLDVLSIGSSQLTQSHFNENWDNLHNGGGVPVNTQDEYEAIKENAGPMLVRTYSGTKNVPTLAKIHEKCLNIAWHAFSFWWFNLLDGRGSNTLKKNLHEHFDAIKYVATTGKPVEPNVPHHFAFRGADDITYIISGYLASKACKLLGIKHLILQNMFNTPKYTWGVQDIAKGRAMLMLVRQLEDDNFKVSLQTRAGLDYFSTDLDTAKIQLATVTCMMDDLEPNNPDSPEIIHVVNYSEAVRLATPNIINESIQITLKALHEYRAAKASGKMPDITTNSDINKRTTELYEEAKNAINLLEDNIPNLYTPDGFNIIFKAGFLPTPYLMDFHGEYPEATKWQTAIKDGGIRVINSKGQIIDTVERYNKIIAQLTSK